MVGRSFIRSELTIVQQFESFGMVFYYCVELNVNDRRWQCKPQ